MKNSRKREGLVLDNQRRKKGRFDTTQQLKSIIRIAGLRHLNHALQVTSFNHKIKLKTYNYPTHTRERN